MIGGSGEGAEANILHLELTFGIGEGELAPGLSERFSRELGSQAARLAALEGLLEEEGRKPGIYRMTLKVERTSAPPAAASAELRVLVPGGFEVGP